MMKKLTVIRGATQTANTKEDITAKVCELCNCIMEKNRLKTKDLLSIQFSITNDITVLNPATALRLGPSAFDSSKVALFCTQEAFVEGGSPLMIRVMFTTYMSRFTRKQNIYINGAEKLRPDFTTK